MTEKIDINELLREQQRERERQITEAVIAAVGSAPPWQVATVIQFEIPPTLMPLQHSTTGQQIVSEVKVTLTRFNSTRDEGDGDGYISVDLLGRPAKADGTPDQRYQPTWNFGPNDVAAPLLLAATIRSSVPVPGGTE